jgi:hypothetical protein
MIVPLGDLPDWLPAWCRDHLGDEPSDVLFQLPVTGAGSLAVHAEEFRPGGEVLGGDSPDVAARYAQVFARLMTELADVTVAPPLPNPPWVRWDHTGSGVWPAIDVLDDRDQSVVPGYVADTAERARRRILAPGLPSVLGHADFEAQNLRWHGHEVWAVHDWDSLAWQPEAALAGAASGSFASSGPPMLAPVEAPRRSWWLTRTFAGACSRPWSRRSRGRPACGWLRTMRRKKHCAAIPRWVAMRSGRKQPNASAGPMPSKPLEQGRSRRLAVLGAGDLEGGGHDGRLPV